MSRVYFHNPDIDGLELSGPERAYMGYIISSFALALLDPKNNEAVLKSKLPADNYLHNYTGDAFGRYFENWFRVSDGRFTTPDADVFAIALDTAYKFGNDQIKLMCRIHGQCEIYCFVRPENMRWLANIIRDGLESGIYRYDMGWEKIAYAAENYTGNSPFVLSYSVCDGFPNSDLAGMDSDEFYELPDAAQWDLCVKSLHPSLEIKPDNWNTYHFRTGETVFDLVEERAVWEGR